MTEWDVDEKSCVEKCELPYEYNADKGKCEIKCPNGLYKDEEGNAVPSYFSDAQGACIPTCEDGYIFDR